METLKAKICPSNHVYQEVLGVGTFARCRNQDWTHTTDRTSIEWCRHSAEDLLGCVCIRVGAVLLQRHPTTQWNPWAYASLCMSEKFADFVVRKRIKLQTDKPLVPLLSTTHLDCMPPRILRFRLRLARFDYSIEHIPGKLLCTADALYRTPLDSAPQSEEIEKTVVCAVPCGILTSKKRASRQLPWGSESWPNLQQAHPVHQTCLAKQTPGERRLMSLLGSEIGNHYHSCQGGELHRSEILGVR